MSDEESGSRFREHLRELRSALSGVGRDVKINVADAPHAAKEGTKNVFARAAGIKRGPMRSWGTSTDEREE